jgi:hypothetical protein
MHPGERELPRRDAFLGCQLLHALHQRQISLERIALEAREIQPPVLLAAKRTQQCLPSAAAPGGRWWHPPNSSMACRPKQICCV